MDTYITIKEILQIIHMNYRTLTKLTNNNSIESFKIGNKRYYNLNKFLISKGISIVKKNIKKYNIIYSRVSSYKQKNDLVRQLKNLKVLYPNHKSISEIGSGLNNNRSGLKKNYRLCYKRKNKRSRSNV